MKVSDLLQQKGEEVVAIGPDASIGDALRLMNERRIGALMVLDADSAIAGILSERDILQSVCSNAGEACRQSVKRAMTPKDQLVIGTVEDDVNYLMNVMTDKRVRHVPILCDGALAGILSIGDVVKSQLDATNHENKKLLDYIEGHYPA